MTSENCYTRLIIKAKAEANIYPGNDLQCAATKLCHNRIMPLLGDFSMIDKTVKLAASIFSVNQSTHIVHSVT